MKRIKLLPYAAASFLLGALLFGTPAATKAFHPFFQVIQDAHQDVVTFIFGSSTQDHSGAKTAPPDPMAASTEMQTSGEKTSKRFDTWEQALEFVSFPPISLHDVPPGFTLTDVQLFFTDARQKANEAVLRYTKDDSSFRVVIRMIENNETISTVADKKSSTVETVQVHGSDAYLTISNDGRLRLEYLFANLHLSISGNLKKEDALRIANQIK